MSANATSPACVGCGADATAMLIHDLDGSVARVLAIEYPRLMYRTEHRSRLDYAPVLYAECGECGKSANSLWLLLGLVRPPTRSTSRSAAFASPEI